MKDSVSILAIKHVNHHVLITAHGLVILTAVLDAVMAANKDAPDVHHVPVIVKIQ